MSDEEQKLISEVNRANRAKHLLEDDLIKQAFIDIESHYLGVWQNSPARDTKGREKIWWALKMLKKVRSDLETHVETGKLATTQLEKLREGIRRIF